MLKEKEKKQKRGKKIEGEGRIEEKGEGQMNLISRMIQ